MRLTLSNKRTKPKSPSMLGKIRLQKHHLEMFMRDFDEEGDPEYPEFIEWCKRRSNII